MITKYKPLYPEVFVYKNGKSKDGFTVLDAITGNFIEELDDILMFNCTFKRRHGHRGVLGIPSYNYNEYIESFMVRGWLELKYRSNKFIKPHFTHTVGQPDKVTIVHMINGKIMYKGGGFNHDPYIKMYIETKIYTKPARGFENEYEDSDEEDDN